VHPIVYEDVTWPLYQGLGKWCKKVKILDTVIALLNHFLLLTVYFSNENCMAKSQKLHSP
jgi:hypothetical protein